MTVKDIQYRKSLPRFLWTRLVSRLGPRWALGPGSLIHLASAETRPLPGPEWVHVHPRLAGICGSDVATIRARSTPYFSPMLSYPFVLGHEVVGVVGGVGADVKDLETGDRVVIEPVLHCAVRGVDQRCGPCRAGDTGLCERTAEGAIEPGIQTGFCTSTGGGWGPDLVAHRLQCHRVPDGWHDEAAVLVEPFACAIHAVASEPPAAGETVLVIGCGTIGLLVIAAVRALGFDNPILASALADHQGEWAIRLGATERVPTGKPLYEEIARRTGGRILRPEIGPPVLTGGVGIVYDCVASTSTIQQALRLACPRGRVVLVGMPGVPLGVDWTGIWHRELKVRGVYAYGTERIGGESRRTFDLAIDLMQDREETLRGLVTHQYGLEEFREAIPVAATPERYEAVKVAFRMAGGVE